MEVADHVLFSPMAKMVLGTRRPCLTKGKNQTERECSSSNHPRAIHDSQTQFNKGAIANGEAGIYAGLVARNKDLSYLHEHMSVR